MTIRSSAAKPQVCFINAGRFGPPLDQTQARKFELLAGIADVHVVGLAAGWKPRRFTSHARFHLLPRVGGRLGRYAMLGVGGTLALAAVTARHRIDVIVAQSPYEAAAAVGVKRLLAWFGRRVACVVESHGDFEVALLEYRRVRFERLYKLLLPKLARFSVRQADALRAVSSSTAHQLGRMATPGRDVHVFHTWTDLDRFFSTPVSQKRSGQILYAGALVPAKGVHHLLDAVGKLVARGRALRLLLVGHNENPAYAMELRHQVERLGVANHVAFRDRVSQAELAALMHESQALVLPSTSSEGLPRVILEAMASGTAVVATAIAGAVDVVGEGTTGFLVPPADANALAERLELILSDPATTERMGSAARQIARRDFSTEHYWRGYARLFTDALEAAASGQPGRRPMAELG